MLELSPMLAVRELVAVQGAELPSERVFTPIMPGYKVKPGDA